MHKIKYQMMFGIKILANRNKQRAHPVFQNKVNCANTFDKRQRQQN